MGLTFDAAITAFRPRLPLAVALSGGADSTALLAACAARWPGQVSAIHVHHGLQAAADGFERHCVALCAQLDVPLAIERVDARHGPGQSPEDAARSARYEALSSAARKASIPTVALAQHADDQVETVLLALSRGAGLAGLAGMRPRWETGGVAYERPLLQVAAPAIRAWLGRRGLTWVEDPSNSNEQFTRNRIRARLLPAIADAFPPFRDTFARSARHAAQAQELLDELAVEDLGATGDPPRLAGLRGLSRARQANLLRGWLKRAHGEQASAAQLDELLDQVAACTTRGHDIVIKVGSGFVTRDGERLAFTP